MSTKNRFINLLLIGVQGGGKSSLKKIFLQDYSDTPRSSSIEITHLRSIAGHSDFGAALWEIPSAYFEEQIAKNYFNDKNGTFIVQPVNEPISYKKLEEQIKGVTAATNQGPIAIVLNKTDLPFTIPQVQLYKNLQKILIKYLPLEKFGIFETSTSTHEGVNEVFNWMFSSVITDNK